MHVDKLGHEIKWQMQEVIGIHPDKMPSALRKFFFQSGGLEMIAADKLSPTLQRVINDLDLPKIHPKKMIHRLRYRFRNHAQSDLIFFNGRFADVYMSALAALLAKKMKVSPLY